MSPGVAYLESRFTEAFTGTITCTVDLAGMGLIVPTAENLLRQFDIPADSTTTILSITIFTNVNVNKLIAQLFEAVWCKMVGHVHEQLLTNATVRIISTVRVASIPLPHKPTHCI